MAQQIGVAFEQELVDDGNGGLCTSQRVSPYTLATIGLPSPGDPDQEIGEATGTPAALDDLAQRLGLQKGLRPQPAAPLMNLQMVLRPPLRGQSDFGELSERYLDSLFGDEEACESARRDLQAHILPRFGQLRLDQIKGSGIPGWLASQETDRSGGRAERRRTASGSGNCWGRCGPSPST